MIESVPFLVMVNDVPDELQHLEYYAQAWAPALILDIARLEKVQDVATKFMTAV